MSDERKMHATYLDGELRIPMWDMLSLLDTEGKRDLAQRLACEEDVIAAVVGQILTGYTENSSWGERGVLDAQRQRIIESVGTEIQRRVVREALQAAESAKAAEKRADEEKNAVLRAVRDFARDCPQDLGCRTIVSVLWKCRAEWKSGRHVPDEEAVAFIEQAAAEIAARAASGGAR